MSIDRRKLLCLFAASAATALAGCGGGGNYVVPTRSVWVLNLNAEFPSVDVAFGPTVVTAGLPFQALTPAIELDFGTYTLGLRNPASGRTLYFDGIVVDDFSPSLEVFYRKGNSARLGASPVGIVNYFDSSESLDVELYADPGGVQTARLAFEASIGQASQSVNCRLLLRRASDGVLVYDSGTRFRTDAILVFPADPLTGLVGVVGLNYGVNNLSVVSWSNLLAA